MTVTTQAFTHSAVDETRFAAFVAKVTKSNLRLRGKGHRDYVDMTDADCEEAARSYCSMYRHQFRALIPVASIEEARRASRPVPAVEPAWCTAPCDCGASTRGHTCP